MTQFANGAGFAQPFANNFGVAIQPTNRYLVQEPLGKRPFPSDLESEMEYVPRAKRRFDKISACLENFSISKETPTNTNELLMDSSSDDDNDGMEEEMIDIDACTSQSEPIISEPDDEPLTLKKLKLDDSLKSFLERAKQSPDAFLPHKSPKRGDEVVLWNPRLILTPKNEVNMSGRITEISEEDEKQIEDENRRKLIETEGMLDDEQINELMASHGIVEFSSSDGSNSDMGSSCSSPSSQIVEIDDINTRECNTPTSLTNGSVSDEDIMEFDEY
ncbi:unnamed protein product [Caenorhabditis bovis]|uniref:Uncharacterized protein n=1 Tax=Caenorhabditis bovis TaxID=2654633 RepID=A0A8S1EUP8_9PELO|nr:unnamed protein product [Caenorhabditis bovis]